MWRANLKYAFPPAIALISCASGTGGSIDDKTIIDQIELSAAAKQQIVDWVSKMPRDYYVLSEKADKMGARDLQLVSKDEHLRLILNPDLPTENAGGEYDENVFIPEYIKGGPRDNSTLPASGQIFSDFACSGNRNTRIPAG